MAMKLSERALIHADKVQEEGLYVTANVLAACAEALEECLESDMTAKQYRTAIQKLDLSQVRAAELFGASGRSGQNWAYKGPPEPVAILIRLMLAGKISADDIAAIRGVQ
jgi:hypothetical protein